MVKVKCAGCNWEGKESELLDDTFSKDKNVFCLSCGCEGWLIKEHYDSEKKFDYTIVNGWLIHKDKDQYVVDDECGNKYYCSTYDEAVETVINRL